MSHETCMEWITTSTVLEGLRDFGNDDAWELFNARFRKPIVGFVRNMGLASSDAEDVAQETLLAFAKAFQKGNFDQDKGRLSKWLFGIAYRQALRARQSAAKRERQVRHSGGDTSFWSGLPDEDKANQAWDAEWERAVLAHSIERVRHEVEAKTYQAFEMVVLEKQSPAEVADKLGMTRNAVFIAKHRVVTRIRQHRRDFEDVN